MIDKVSAARKYAHDVVLPISALSMLLSATFDRAARAMDQGDDAGETKSAMRAIIECVVGGNDADG